MKLQRVAFLGVRGVKDATYDLARAGTGGPHDVVVISGPTASGKTRLLEALMAAKEAIGPYGLMVVGAPWIAPGAPVSTIELTFSLDEAERAFAKASSKVVDAEVTFLPGRARAVAPGGLIALLGRYTHDPSKGKFEYFPANRRLPSFGPFDGCSSAEQMLYRAGKEGRKYSFVVNGLRALSNDPEQAARFAAKLSKLSATVRYVAPAAAGEGPLHCLSSRGGAPRGPGELSDAEADAVLFAATAVAIGLDGSVLLIDRPDLYVDPQGLPSFVAGLLALGAGNQVFLASSNPSVAAAAERAFVIALEGG